MLRDHGGELLFESTDRIYCTCEVLDLKLDQSQSEYTHHLVVRAIYDVVYLLTNTSSPIEALRLKRNTARLELFGRASTNKIGDLIRSYTFDEGLVELIIQPGDIEPAYNCHGYCFADSKYWINDDQVPGLLHGDGYLESKADIDVAIVTFRQGGTIKHTARRHRHNGGFLYISKAGVRGLQKTTRLEDAARGLPHDSVDVYQSYLRQ